MLAFCFLAFIGFGMVLVLVGANQHALAVSLDLTLAQTGQLSSALALGIGLGVVAAGPLFDRFARRPLFVAFLGASAATLLFVESDMSFERWLVQLCLTGFAVGGYDTLINGAVAQRYAGNSTRPMTIAHAGASVGAMLGPLLMGALATHFGWITNFHATGLVHVALAVLALGVKFPDPPVRHSSEPRIRVPLAPLAPFAVIAFAYVGIEACLTVFAIPYGETLGLPSDRGRLAISAVWLGLFAGRLGCVALPGVLDARTLALAGALGASLIAGSVALATTWIEVCFFAIGLALGCVYPLMIALTAQRFPNAEGTAAGMVAGAGALGGFVLPWFTGALGDTSGLAIGLGSLALWSLAIALAARVGRGSGGP